MSTRAKFLRFIADSGRLEMGDVGMMHECASMMAEYERAFSYEERAAWDRFAAASVTSGRSSTAVAAQADLLMAERRKRYPGAEPR